MQVSNANRRSITLPLGISEGEAPLAELKQLAGGLELVVPDDYEQLVRSNELSGEVFAIQRLLAISRLEIQITVLWGLAISQRLPEITRLQPLLAVALMLQGVSHRLSGLESPHAEQVLTAARQGVLKHRLIRDLFSPRSVGGRREVPDDPSAT